MTKLTFSNHRIEFTLRPDLGGRIDQITDRVRKRDWLWHPRVYSGKERELKLGSSFDENWSGGWDEIFPNDAAGDFRGKKLVDHGELWSQAWDVLEKSDRGGKLVYRCKSVPVQVEKSIVVHETDPRATLQYVFRNESDEEVPFLFKMHAAIAIEPGDQVLLPPCTVEPVDLGFSRLIGQAKKTEFPSAYDHGGKNIRLDRVPSPFPDGREFYYCTDLERGECGIGNSKSRSALRMKFSLQDFPYVWNFQSFGGFRDHYVAVVEPCTTIPWDLEKALAQGTCAKLRPREIQQRSLQISIEDFRP